MEVTMSERDHLGFVPEHLQRALAYSPQHQQAVANAMHRAMPDLWPSGPIEECSFYERLHASLFDPTRRECLRRTLSNLAKRKRKEHWAVTLDLTSRLERVACDRASAGLDGQAIQSKDIEGLLEEQAASGFSELANLHSWLKKHWPPTANQAASSKPIDREVPAASDSETLVQNWRELLENLSSLAVAATSKQPNQECLHDLAFQVEQLSELLIHYQAIVSVVPQALLDRAFWLCSKASKDPESRDQAKAVQTALSSFGGTTEQLSHWCDSLEQALDRLEHALTQHSERDEELRQAVDAQDYAAVGQQSALAERAKSAVSDAHQQLQSLLSALPGMAESAAHETSIPSKEELLSAAPAAQPAPDNGSTTADVAVRPESALELPSIHQAHASDNATVEPPTNSGNLEADPSTANADQPTFLNQGVIQGSSAGREQTGALPDSAPVSLVSSQAALGSGHQVEPTLGCEAASNNEPERNRTTGESIQADNEDWLAAVSLVELAEALRQAPPSARARIGRRLAWALIRDDRVPLAYHFAVCAAAQEHPAVGDLSPEPIRALHLASQLRGGAGEDVMELAATLNGLLAGCLAEDASRKDPANTALIFAATIRPALLAPDVSGARTVLQSLCLDERYSRLHELRELVLSPGFYFSAMIQEGEAGAWEQRLKSLQERCRTWWEDNRHRTYKYMPATTLWRHFLKSDGPLGRTLGFVLDNRMEAVAEATEVIANLHSRTRVSAWINEVDTTLRHGNASRKPIEAGPRTDMVRRCADAAKLIDEWVSLVRAHPEQRQRGREDGVASARDRFLGIIAAAQAQLAELENESTLPLTAVARAAHRALGQLQDLFDTDVSSASPDVPWWQSLNVDLLHVDGLRMAEHDWSPQWEQFRGPEPLVALLAVLAPLPLTEIYRLGAERCDHGATGRIIDWLRVGTGAHDDADIERLESDRERGLSRCRKLLAELVAKTADEVEQAVRHGYIGESERLELTTRIADLDGPSSDDIESLEYRAKDVAQAVREARQRHVGEIRIRLQGMDLSSAEPDIGERIDQLLVDGDVLTASEYVALLENGQSPPSSAENRDPFAGEFFPAFVEDINDGLIGSRDGGAQQVLDAVENGRNFGPLDIRAVPGAQTRTAATMLRSWHDLKTRRGDQQERLKGFLENLGFRVRNLSRSDQRTRDSNQAWYELETQPIADRDICVVPRYGSSTAGNYRVLCLWQRPSEDEVLTAALAGPGTHPLFVLYLGHLSVKRRRDLAYRSRERRQRLLLLDESLVYFLCGERGSRLPTLFNCAFPFTIDQPYVSTSSDVPSELFFGRKREREAIFDLAGTNLVYGGRQLGKTALLRDVVRRHHNLDRGCVVTWIDLKEHHIGITRPAAEVWQVIDRALQQEHVLPRRERGADRTIEVIGEWLNERPERRIVVLLDEADAFLSQDSRDSHYRTVGTLKGLMERTQRRFKVVFAGLHDVQRASRDVNTPLAHLGAPLCIGPLLENGEVREAYRLVERPFSQLGYRFASPELISRILSYTNYYPNLIQIFCSHLLEYLNDSATGRFNPAVVPPYLVTGEHIENASRRSDLQRIIRQRFQITLDLDNRYQVLALVIAMETLERRERALDSADGFDVGWIRENTLIWWAKGFEDRSFDAFRTLLDEMVGLGVLRRTGPGLRHYALRSPAIANLLGTRRDIEHALDDASQQAPPAVYEAGTFRRALPGDPWMRSPLSGQQESDILATESGVAILFGSSLAGLADVDPFLRASVNEKTFLSLLELPCVEGSNGFKERLASAFDSYQGEGTQLVVVPVKDSWSANWVADALRLVSRRRGGKAHRRVLFLGDPHVAWAWTDPSIRLPEQPGLTLISLSPWAPSVLELWVRDAGFGPCGEAEREEFRMATGLWGSMLSRLARHIQRDPIQWRRGLEQFIAEASEGADLGLAEDIPDAARPALEVLAQYGSGLGAEELVELLDDKGAAFVQRFIRWGDMLGFLQPEGGGRWRIDSIVARSLAD